MIKIGVLKETGREAVFRSLVIKLLVNDLQGMFTLGIVNGISKAFPICADVDIGPV